MPSPEGGHLLHNRTSLSHPTPQSVVLGPQPATSSRWATNSPAHQADTTCSRCSGLRSSSLAVPPACTVEHIPAADRSCSSCLLPAASSAPLSAAQAARSLGQPHCKTAPHLAVTLPSAVAPLRQAWSLTKHHLVGPHPASCRPSAHAPDGAPAPCGIHSQHSTVLLPASPAAVPTCVCECNQAALSSSCCLNGAGPVPMLATASLSCCSTA